MIDGIYSINFRGAVTWGQGMLVLQKGAVTGADAAGVMYQGQYSESNEAIVLDLVMTVPPGALLVQGTPPRATAYNVPFKATVPKTSIENSQPVLVSLPPGPVNVIVKRLREL